jgi:sugar phosphate isomerase/epimerase
MPLKNYKRRDFLKLSSGLIAVPFIPTSYFAKKYKPLLSFSTLGCPDWPFEKIVDFAAANNYDGIEFRGIERELDLTKCKAFSEQNISASIQLLQNKNLRVVDLGSSCELHHQEGEERQKNLDEAKRFIDLAQKLDCPYIRVFPNDFPDDQAHEQTIQLIVKGLKYLGDYAANKNVTVLLETHGKVVYTADILNIMQQTNHPHTGLVWDAYNMWSITKEPPAQVYSSLKKYIKHTHIKDAKMVNGKEQYVLMGTGDSAIFEAVDILAKNNYTGYYSFEWEKLWHPEIDPPEIAIAQYPKAMREHFEK